LKRNNRKAHLKLFFKMVVSEGDRRMEVTKKEAGLLCMYLVKQL
jgi:hypothetical protein